MRKILALAGLLMVAADCGAHAQTHLFANGEAVQLDPAQAYVLVRTQDLVGGGLHGTSSQSPLLYRVLDDAELAADQALADKDPKHWQDKAAPNVVLMMAAKAYQHAGGQALMLAAVRPGTYVLGGMTSSNWASTDAGAMVASLSMGTVKFEAKPGLVTDLGTILLALDTRPTDIPELRNVVRGGDEDGLSFTNMVAVRPAPQSTPVPAALASLPLAPADWRAVPAFPNYTGAWLSRLAPMPGVLDYDKDGDVVDLKAAALVVPATPPAPLEPAIIVGPARPPAGAPTPVAIAAPAARSSGGAAGTKDAMAQFRIGYADEQGDGVAKDYAEAMRLYRLSAAQGNAMAQFRIGYLYENGWGVTRDYAQAMQWYEKAAAEGNAVAEFRIGYLYENGWGVTQDHAQAMQWYEKAAARGDQPAAKRLAVLKAKHP